MPCPRGHAAPAADCTLCRAARMDSRYARMWGLPFPATPAAAPLRAWEPGRPLVRHLLYHVYPALSAEGIWRWNLEMLRRRLSLFNGRRLVAVAADATTASAEVVRGLLPCCDVREYPNDPRLKEMVSFPHLLEAVSDLTGPEHVTFYGHAKGVTSAAWGAGVRPWTEAMYVLCLDYWPVVERELARAPLVGAFRRHNYGFGGHSRSSWHYAGSFRWVRNRDLFRRDWREIDPFWCGSETHPSLHFSVDEAACLAGEFHGDGLAIYEGEPWQGWAGEAVQQFTLNNLADRWVPLLVTCILTSHRKPGYVHDAIASVLAQTTPDWQLVVIDTGDLVTGGEFARYSSDPRVLVVCSGETSDMRGRVNLQSWKINEVFRRGLVRGDLICYLPDDDVYAPHAFATFLAAARSHPHQNAWYGAVDRVEVRPEGERHVGILPAEVVGGLGGISLDCKADGMQVFHRACVRVPWNEEVSLASHGDGVFLDLLGRQTAIHPLPVTIGRHRHTPLSTFTRPAGY